MRTNYSVPFKIVNINHGLQEAAGLIKVVDGGLELEFEVKDTLLGIVKSGVRVVQIPYEKLVTLSFKKGLIRSKIIMEGISMNAFSGLPGVDVATCELRVKRKDSKEAEQLISKARVGLSEYKLNELDN